MSTTTRRASISELNRHLKAITSEVRLSGTAEESRAFDYIGEQLAGWGYTVNRYELDALTGYPIAASLTMESPERIVFPTNGYSLSPATEESGVSAEVIDLGKGSDADFAAANVAGKIVITDGLATPAKGLAAARAGAVGYIHINGDRIYEMCISPVWGTPTPETAQFLPSVPAVAVTQESGTKIREALATGAVTINLMTRPYKGWSTLPVLTADLPGAVEDTYVLFSGHVDSWHLGVMDNGTANATQLEVARLLAEQQGELRRGVRLAFWSGHSHARYAGSTWYADNFFDDLATQCICHVNIDSVGAKGATVLDDAPSMAESYSFLRDIMQKEVGVELGYHRISRSSDQSFWGHGIPTVLAALSSQPIDDSPTSKAHFAMFGSGGLGWWWHTPEDTLDKIDDAFFERDANIYFSTMLELLESERLPFDPSAGLREIAEALGKFETQSSGILELSSLRERALALTARAGREQISQLPTEQANRVTSDLLRLIIPVNFTITGPYDHDLALGTTPVPGLAEVATLATLGDETAEYRFLRTKLVRQRNRLSGVLHQIERELVHNGL